MTDADAREWLEQFRRFGVNPLAGWCEVWVMTRHGRYDALAPTLAEAVAVIRAASGIE